MNKTEIHDDETLFRRVLVHKQNILEHDKRYRWNRQLEKFDVLPLAFYHKKNRVSVDKLDETNADGKKTQGDSLNGVAQLIVKMISSMDDISPFKVNIKPEPVEENIDDNIKENTAHCVITMQPDDKVLDNEYKEQRINFRQNLADIANNLGWVIEPESCIKDDLNNVDK